MGLKKTLDYVLAFVHFGLLIVVIGYGVYSLASGALARGMLILVLVGVYYVFVLHEAVVREIKRKKALRK